MASPGEAGILTEEVVSYWKPTTRTALESLHSLHSSHCQDHGFPPCIPVNPVIARDRRPPGCVVPSTHCGGQVWPGELVLPSLTRFADAGVDLFFVISGFVMTIIAANRYHSPANAGRFLANRTWRVLPPYWIYTTLVVALMFMVPDMVNTSYADQSILASYLLWPQQQLPILTVGWTLIHEMYFYLVMASAIALLHQRSMPVFLLAWASVVLVAQALPVASAPPWIAIASSPLTLEFIGGALVGLYWRKLSRPLSSSCLLLGGIGFVLGMFALGQSTTWPLEAMQRTLIFGPCSILIVAGVTALERYRSWSAPGWLTAIGDSSYSLYLSHVFVVSAAGRLWQATSLNATTSQHVLFASSTVLASVFVGLASHRWIERPLLAIGDGFAWRKRAARSSAA